MKKVAALLCMVLAVGLVLAGEVAKEKAMGKTHEMTVEVVSIDAEAKMITVKDEKGEEHKAPVIGKALASLKTVKAGDRVIVTCQDDEAGEHIGVSKIERVKM